MGLAQLRKQSPKNKTNYRSVDTKKRAATGKGNASKSMMIDAARAKGFHPKDDNEADAIAILLWAIDTKGGVK